MENLIIVYWRDIPAQIIIGKGRGAKKVALNSRFEHAIDRCAMKVGAKDADSYISEWHKKVIGKITRNEDSILQKVTMIETTYSPERVKRIIDNDGWDNIKSDLGFED